MSEGDPSVDPVILWLNGGPGASGIIGMLTELGQLQTVPSPGDSPRAGNDHHEGSEVPRLYHNQFGWTKAASLFTIEQPKGVGFSYCTGAGPCVNTDESTAEDTYEAIVAFFKAFPELASRPFIITGESYAGVYIPMIIDQIDQHGGVPNFAGAMIGNGCWGSDCFYGVTEAQIDFHTFLGQDFMSPTLAASIETKCGGVWLNATQPEGTCGDYQSTSVDTGANECLEALAEMCKQVGNEQFNVYNMYDTCYPQHQLSLDQIRQKLRSSQVELTSFSDALRSHPVLYTSARNSFRATDPADLGQLNDYSCDSETLMEKWLQSSEVQQALHVNASGGGMHYRQTCGDLRNLYAKLVPKYRILIYSGNVDACVPTWGSEQWTTELGSKYGIETEWHPWTSASADPGSSRKVLAGYAQTWAVNNFTFATVKGAGHEVPRYKPSFALTLLKTFLAGQNP